MPLEKRIGYGCTLEVSTDSGSTWEALGNIIDGWSGPDTSADDVETTVLADTYKTFVRAQIDPGTVQFTFAYDPNDTDTQALVTLYSSGDTADWRITFYDAGTGTDTETFQGYVNSLSREMTKDSLVAATVGIKVSGDPGYSAS